MSETEILDVLDRGGRAIGTKSRALVHRDDDWHRLVFVWGAWARTDGTSMILLQRRGAPRDPFPGCADALGSGHVLSGQSPTEAAQQELLEEVGLDVEAADLELLMSGPHDRPGAGCRRTFQHHFLLNRSIARGEVAFTPEVDGYFLTRLDGLAQLLDGAVDSVEAQRWSPWGDGLTEMTRKDLHYPPPIVAAFRSSVATLRARVS